VLTGARELVCASATLRCLHDNNRHFGTPRFVASIERDAAKVAEQRRGSILTVGDISARVGGHLPTHASHRTGRDADLLFYFTTLEGAPVTTPNFLHVDSDGLAWDPSSKRFLRIDIERQWLLVKELLSDDNARIQWLFVSQPVKAMLIEWARARGESGEILTRAMDVLWQPSPPAQSHDDHLHARTACDPDEVTSGCEPFGPVRPWIAAIDAKAVAIAVPPATLEALLEDILRPIETGNARASR